MTDGDMLGQPNHVFKIYFEYGKSLTNTYSKVCNLFDTNNRLNKSTMQSFETKRGIHLKKVW